MLTLPIEAEAPYRRGNCRESHTREEPNRETILWFQNKSVKIQHKCIEPVDDQIINKEEKSKTS